MKFAVPLAEGKLTTHFGHCQQFAILDVENSEIVNQDFMTPPPHEPGVLPKRLHELGATVIIDGGMGQRAVMLFNQAGIEVITGAPAEDPVMLVKQYLNNTLDAGENACDTDHSGHGDHACHN
jgi:predicted Fe-Mo cluster-binding NifX family protein